MENASEHKEASRVIPIQGRAVKVMTDILAPVWKKESGHVDHDGSFEKINEFNTSPFNAAMKRLANECKDP